MKTYALYLESDSNCPNASEVLCETCRPGKPGWFA